MRYIPVGGPATRGSARLHTSTRFVSRPLHPRKGKPVARRGRKATGPYSRLRCAGRRAAEGMGGSDCAVGTSPRVDAHGLIPLTLPHGEGLWAANFPSVSPHAEAV